MTSCSIPTCGSGTTAYVAEQWGRRWITIDTSRVALALARARIMGARYPLLLALRQPRRGRSNRRRLSAGPLRISHVYGDIRQGFVYERVPHITLRAIANNSEIDVIWEDAQKDLETLQEGIEPACSVNRGRSGRFPAMSDEDLARMKQRTITPSGGSDASPARRRLTPP